VAFAQLDASHDHALSHARQRAREVDLYTVLGANRLQSNAQTRQLSEDLENCAHILPKVPAGSGKQKE
jgi:hypothetical protein